MLQLKSDSPENAKVRTRTGAVAEDREDGIHVKDI